MADNNVKNYVEQGGERSVIGGSIDIASGGEIDIESGGKVKIAGTQVAVTAAQINNLVQGAAANKAFTSGEVAFTGSVSFDTGLSTLDAVLVSMVSDPSVTDAFWVTALKASTVGWVEVYAWKPTAADNLEPAEGSASVTAAWFVSGEAS